MIITTYTKSGLLDHHQLASLYHDLNNETMVLGAAVVLAKVGLIRPVMLACQKERKKHGGC
jgi:hypothetical protein